MKIRTGFVSNSSSSSFIISNRSFKSIRDLAIHMINKQIQEYEYEESLDDWNKQYIQQNKEYIERLYKIDENQPVSFPSCNYDTYITKMGDCYLVSTCNNTDWELWDYSTRLTSSARKDLIKLIDNYEKNSDDYRNIQSLLDDEQEFYHIGKNFYDLSVELIGVETYDECPNKKADKDYGHYLWDTVKWGKICPRCNPIFKRKDKLDIINQFANKD